MLTRQSDASMKGAIPYSTRIEFAAEILGLSSVDLRQALDQGPSDRILDYEGASELLGISVGALRLRVHRGTIPHIRQGMRTVRFSERALLKAAGQ